MAPFPMKKNLTELVFILDKSGSMALLDAMGQTIHKDMKKRRHRR